MNKSLVIGIVVVLVVIAGGGAAYMMMHNSKEKNEYSNSTNSNSSMSNMPSSTGSQNTSSTPSIPNSITIENFAFSPTGMVVKKGTTVTWTNKDSTAHTVTESDGQTGPNSGNLAPAGTYTFTFNTAGTFHYHCAIHPSMTGSVTVTE